MKITQFDTWNTLFDNISKPLVGKMVFTDRTTKQPAEVYDSAGNNLGSIVYVNGVSDYQVFVNSSKEYTVFLYKYIGSGSFRTDTNESNFILVRSIDFVSNGVNGGIVTNNDILWGIDSLKSLDTDNLSEGYTVQVAGYYGTRAGQPQTFDSSEVFLRTYTWSPNSQLPNDNGVVIGNSNQTGKWLLDMNLPYIDVRWYGVIAADNKTAMSRIASAAYAATLWKKDLYFPAGVYALDGSNVITLSGKIITDNDVVFNLTKNTSSITCDEIISNTHQLFTGNVPLNITCNKLKTSWVEGILLQNDLNNVKETIIDNDTERLISGHFSVVPILSLTKVRLQSALTSSKGFLKGGSITNCVIKEDWFLVHDATKYNVSDCIVDNTSFVNKSFYVDLKNKLGQSDYGDMNGYIFDTEKSLIEGAVISNAKGKLKPTVSATIEKFYGEIKLTSGTKLQSLNLNHSNVKLEGEIDVLSAKDTTFNNPIVTGQTSILENCSISADDNNTNRFVFYYNNLNNCRLSKIYITCLDNMNGSYVHTIKNCSFYDGAAIYEQSTNNSVTNTRESIFINNIGLKLIDTKSKVTKLGQSFRWENNGDSIGNKEYVTCSFIGERSSSNPIVWNDFTDGLNNSECALFKRVGSSSGAISYVIVWRVVPNKNKQPWTLPENSVIRNYTLSLKNNTTDELLGNGIFSTSYLTNTEDVTVLYDGRTCDVLSDGTGHIEVNYSVKRG